MKYIGSVRDLIGDKITKITFLGLLNFSFQGPSYEINVSFKGF